MNSGLSLKTYIKNILVVLLPVFLLHIPSVFAATGLDNELDFDHLTTGYPLNGQHEFVECQQCHRGGVFKGTPKQCLKCHDSVIAVGKPTSHIPTEADCDTCHTLELSFRQTAIMDHGNIDSGCSACHDGDRATGKNEKHIQSTDKCEFCHVTTTFIPPKAVDHQHVLGACSACHNGTISTPKDADHITTNRECNECHSTKYWTPVDNFDHGTITDPVTATSNVCKSCHIEDLYQGHIDTQSDCGVCHLTSTWTGVTFDHATITTETCKDCHSTPGSHLSTGQQCDVCHTTNGNWLLAPLPWDHALQTTERCDGCHNGTIGYIPGKSVTHMPTVLDCGACHVDISNFGTNEFAHPEFAGIACTTCHNNTDAIGMSLTHIPVPAAEAACDNCHTPGAGWNNTTFNHSAISVLEPCTQCHNNTNALGKAMNHITTTDQCHLCHVPDSGAVWVPSRVDHTQVMGSCNECHTQGQEHPNHPMTENACMVCHANDAVNYVWTRPTAALMNHDLVRADCSAAGCHNASRPGNHITIMQPLTCNACHGSTVAWLTDLNMDHAQVDTASCAEAGCHDGSKPTVTYKPPTHKSTSETCGACHVTVPPWSNANMDHTEIRPITPVPTTCVSCHDGVNATGEGVNHVTILTPKLCNECHVTTVGFSAGVQMNHDQLAPFASCNADCHKADGTGTATGWDADHLNDPVRVLPLDCSECHNENVGWLPTDYEHAKIADLFPCTTCHNGTQAQSKGASHITSTDLCDSCHTYDAGVNNSGVNDSWYVVDVDHTQVSLVCMNCHTGTLQLNTPVPTKLTASPPHIQTTDVCGACHDTVSFAPVPGPNVDHNEVLGSCNTCHNQSDLAPNHPGTTNNCAICHNSNGWNVNVIVDHTAVQGRCIDCHFQGNTYSARAKSVTHIASSDNCDRCHTPNTGMDGFLNATYVDHTQVSGQCSNAGCHTKPNTTLHASFTNNCEACHNTMAFLPYDQVNHDTGAGGGFQGAPSCSTCHNNTIAQGRGTRHFIYSPDSPATECDKCHASTAGWRAGANYDENKHEPAAVGQKWLGDHRRFTMEQCSNCHLNNNQNSFARQYPQQGLDRTCAGCHASQFRRSGPHNGNNDTAADFPNCGDSRCHSVSGNGF